MEKAIKKVEERIEELKIARRIVSSKWTERELLDIRIQDMQWVLSTLLTIKKSD